MMRALVALALVAGAAAAPLDTAERRAAGGEGAGVVGRAAAGAAGQRRGYGIPVQPNPGYDGQFTFIRLRYGPEERYVSQQVPWSHDYPTGERHFMQILDEVTLLDPKTDETGILGLDDPELFRHPITYMAEPGFWTLTGEEASAFRAYLLKGGFVIFDDFSEERGGWASFERAFRRVLPEARFFDLDPSHQVFHSFFEIPSFDILPQGYDYGRPVLRAVFEGNDPGGRMLAMINYNADISEFWELSNTGFNPIADTNEAYKLGVNYVMYALTH